MDLLIVVQNETFFSFDKKRGKIGTKHTQWSGQRRYTYTYLLIAGQKGADED
jgi:hypothetical protein